MILYVPALPERWLLASRFGNIPFTVLCARNACAIAGTLSTRPIFVAGLYPYICSALPRGNKPKQ